MPSEDQQTTPQWEFHQDAVLAVEDQTSVFGANPVTLSDQAVADLDVAILDAEGEVVGWAEIREVPIGDNSPLEQQSEQ